MTTGRKLRLALSAAILAALFTFVLVGHAGSHADFASTDPPCAMCSSGETATIGALEAPVFESPRVLRFVSEARRLPEAALQHPPRGPPHAG